MVNHSLSGANFLQEHFDDSPSRSKQNTGLHLKKYIFGNRVVGWVGSFSSAKIEENKKEAGTFSTVLYLYLNLKCVISSFSPLLAVSLVKFPHNIHQKCTWHDLLNINVRYLYAAVFRV